MPPLQRPALLSEHHRVDRFNCGNDALNHFLERFALENQKSGKSRTYVAARKGMVVAYYSLAPASVEVAEVTARVARGQGRAEIPVILLGRLAVDLREQGTGLGGQMLLDALRRAVEGAEVIGGRAVLVHAADERARKFYLHHGFEESPVDLLHLLLLIKDIRKTLGL